MFLTRLDLQDDPQPDMWVVMSPLVWSDPLFGRIEVPVGFRTDLASIPRALRNLKMLDPAGCSRRPAAVHDWLYASQRRHGLADKAVADDFLRDALLAEGASAAQAAAFYYGVHWFGRSAWESDAGALETRDFDTPAHYAAWLASARTVIRGTARKTV